MGFQTGVTNSETAKPTMSLKDRLEAAKNGSVAAATGLVKDQSAAAAPSTQVSAASQQEAEQVLRVPTPSKEGEVVFKTEKNVLNVVDEGGIRISFVNQHYMTDNQKRIEFLKKNAERFRLTFEEYQAPVK